MFVSLTCGISTLLTIDLSDGRCKDCSFLIFWLLLTQCCTDRLGNRFSTHGLNKWAGGLCRTTSHSKIGSSCLRVASFNETPKLLASSARCKRGYHRKSDPSRPRNSMTQSIDPDASANRARTKQPNDFGTTLAINARPSMFITHYNPTMRSPLRPALLID